MPPHDVVEVSIRFGGATYTVRVDAGALVGLALAWGDVMGTHGEWPKSDRPVQAILKRAAREFARVVQKHGRKAANEHEQRSA